MDGDKSPLAILHITQALGGVETYLSLMEAERQRQSLGEVTMSYVLPEKCKLYSQAMKNNQFVTVISMKREISIIEDFKVIVKLRKVIKKTNPDIVHLHSSKAGVLGRLAALFTGTKVIYTPHAYYYLSKKGVSDLFYRFIEIIFGWITDAVITTSESEKERSIRDIKIKPSKVFVFLNSVDIEMLSNIEDKNTDKSTRKWVTLVARITYQKNIEMFLKVVARLNKSDKVKFRLIGVGFDEQDAGTLTELILKSGITSDDVDIIEWLPREDMLRVLSESYISVLTSRYESFGYVLAEAGAMGIPLIGTNVDGIKEIIRDGETGYLVDLGDDRAMAEKIMDLAKSHEKWLSFSSAVRNDVAERMDIMKNWPALIKTYQKILKS